MPLVSGAILAKDWADAFGSFSKSHDGLKQELDRICGDFSNEWYESAPIAKIIERVRSWIEVRIKSACAAMLAELQVSVVALDAAAKAVPALVDEIGKEEITKLRAKTMWAGLCKLPESFTFCSAYTAAVDVLRFFQEALAFAESKGFVCGGFDVSVLKASIDAQTLRSSNLTACVSLWRSPEGKTRAEVVELAKNVLSAKPPCKAVLELMQRGIDGRPCYMKQ